MESIENRTVLSKYKSQYFTRFCSSVAFPCKQIKSDLLKTAHHKYNESVMFTQNKVQIMLVGEKKMLDHQVGDDMHECTEQAVATNAFPIVLLAGFVRSYS